MNLPKKIYTIDQLIFYLDNTENIIFENKVEIIKKYSGNDWKKYIVKDFNDPYYSNQILIPCKTCDLYLITWNPKKESPIHNHSKNGCIMKILNSKKEKNIFLEEERFKIKNKKIIKIQKNFIFPKQIFFIKDSIGLHKIKNNSNNYIYSFHIYNPKGFKTKYFS